MPQQGVSRRSRLLALLLCYFLGVFGAHRFYVGKMGTGVLWLLTLGIFGLGWLVDLVLVAVGAFRDIEGRRVAAWGGA
nr:NINE protein [Actinomycetales bacterium]